ncbi:MAG: hypothetical protein ABR972_10525 [Acidimicrobiales bacterium]|jgi:hypothetical protein
MASACLRVGLPAAALGVAATGRGSFGTATAPAPTTTVPSTTLPAVTTATRLYPNSSPIPVAATTPGPARRLLVRPPGRSAPTDPLYEICVSRTAKGWYVNSVEIDN